MRLYAARLRDVVEAIQPRVLAFNGKTTASLLYRGGTHRLGYGRQSERIGETAVYVLPSTAATSAFWSIEPWREVRRDSVRGTRTVATGERSKALQGVVPVSRHGVVHTVKPRKPPTNQAPRGVRAPPWDRASGFARSEVRRKPTSSSSTISVSNGQSTPLEPTAVRWNSHYRKLQLRRWLPWKSTRLEGGGGGGDAFTIQVQGQSPTTPAIAPTPRIFYLTAEQEFIIREIVLKDLNVPETKSDTPETIGDAVPESIKLHPIPPDVAAKVPQVKSHEFFVKDGKIILVNPSDRLIADVIKKAE